MHAKETGEGEKMEARNQERKNKREFKYRSTVRAHSKCTFPSSNSGGGRSNHGKWSTRARGGGSKGAEFNDESKFSWFPKHRAKSLVAFSFLSPPLFAFSGEGNVQNEVPQLSSSSSSVPECLFQKRGE